MKLLDGQAVLILGLGQSGLAMARWCHLQGARVTVVDTRAHPPQLDTLLGDVPGASFVSSTFDAALVRGSAFRAVFRSPGLAPTESAALTDAAREQGLWVGGELSLFVQALEQLRASESYDPKILAVTGTNGKTTVTSLTGQLVERAGKTVAVAGNIGPTMLDTLRESLQAETLPEVWVLELSSFQLDAVAAFEPTAATVLNITQDHLDWHGSVSAYVAAKAKVLGTVHTRMLLNRDDAQVMALPTSLVPVASALNARGKAVRPPSRDVITFGSDMPQRPGDYGIEVVNGMAWLVRAVELDPTLRSTRTSSRAEEPELHIQRMIPADALRIRGRHNALNALAALGLASSAGCPLAPMLYGLREYRGEPHRVESIGQLQEVEYFDDSKGTNVGATVAALSGLGADRKLVIILGGVGKGQDFSPLAAPVARHARAAILIGRDAPLILSVLQDSGVPLLQASTLEQAVVLAQQQSQVGDAVLLSPACASFDMFDNYAHRSHVFVQAVQALALELGTVLETPS